MSSLTRLAFCGCVFLFLSSCGTLHEPEDRADTGRAVLETAFRNIDRRYAETPALDGLTIAGLNAVVNSDPLAALSRTNGTIALAYNDIGIGQWAEVPDHDHAAWAGIVDEALRRLRENSPSIGETDRERVLEIFFDSGLATLDKYTRYATPQQAKNTRARREGFGGLGITIRLDDGRTYVSAIHPDTPAARSGLLAGDEITHVEGRPLAGLDQGDIIDRLRGPVHSNAELTVHRPGANDPLRIGIVRAHIIPPTVEARRDGDFLYVKLSGFNQGTSRALGRALADAESDGAPPRGIVLDLRANPGGLLDQAVAVSDFFLNNGRIVSTKGRHERANQIFDASWGERARRLPIALLVNGRSASASEIVAAALRDRGRAVIVGSSSFGKGSVQTIIRLPNAGELTMTWAHLIAPSGFNLQGHGVIPAICTSGDAAGLSALMSALKNDDSGASAIFSRLLASRQAIRKDPAKGRRNCPPANANRPEDVEIAKYVLSSPTLYARALTDGGAAIAERPE